MDAINTTTLRQLRQVGPRDLGALSFAQPLSFRYEILNAK